MDIAVCGTELIEIGRVIPYARNLRKNEAAIAKVAASIKEYGFRQLIVMGEYLADMVFTDPSYNVDYGQTMKGNVRGAKRRIKD